MAASASKTGDIVAVLVPKMPAAFLFPSKPRGSSSDARIKSASETPQIPNTESEAADLFDALQD